MDVEATTVAALASGADAIAVGVFEGEDVAHDFGGGTLQALLGRGEARASFRHLATAHHEDRPVILVGLGERDRFESERARVAAALVHARARELGARALCWEVPHHVGDTVVAGLVEGTLLHAYRFARYKPSSSDRELDRLLLSAHHDVSEPARRAGILARAQNRARDLANTPPNHLDPAALSDHARELKGVSVSVLDGEAIRAAGMGAFAAVAQGSPRDPRLIRLEYSGGDAPPVGLIGKAITFDTGGLNLKRGGDMAEMKFDMAGGAAVIEAIAALAELRAPVNVIGVVGAAENMLSGTSVLPGDVVTALDGTTIEVDNPDAEGRLVLADCLTYARREGCRQLVDIATLTGAVVTALGSTYAGLMSSHDELAAMVEACGRETGELVWRLPLHPEYAHMVEGRYAQLTNKPMPRVALTITAAELLHRFAGEVPWAHLDIAGTAWDVRRPYFDRGGTGFGVRLLVAVAERLAASPVA